MDGRCKEILLLFWAQRIDRIFYNQVRVLYFSTSIMKFKFRNLTVTKQLALKNPFEKPGPVKNPRIS